jgi:hypothetical protein
VLSERTGIENKWFALTGRVVELKVEEDGDLHIALLDVTGNKPGVVVSELPASNKTEIGQLTQFAMINCRLPVRTSLAEQEQHYSSPAVSP